MKISKKEKLLLVMLVALLTGVVYYQFIYTAQNEKVDALEVKKAEVQSEYDLLMETIRTLKERQSQIDTYTTTIKLNSQPFYPTLVQEYLILELDQLLSENEMEGNISFTQVTSATVEPFVNASVVKPESSLQPIIDEYNQLETGNQNITNEITQSTTQTSSATVEQLKVSLSFNATYENLKSFISQLEKYERQIVITNIAITPGLNDSVSGSMNLEFYAFPKFSGVDDHYLNWTLNNTYGKETPFSGIGAQVGFNTIEEMGEDNSVKNDFVVLLKSTTSELPTFMMGIPHDTAQSTYISSDNEQIEEVTLTLTQKNEKYYYNYSNSLQSFPTNGELEFSPAKEINVQVKSEARSTSDDLSGIRFNVINDSDKAVNVTILNDDSQNPRITVAGVGNPVNVVKK